MARSIFETLTVLIVDDSKYMRRLLSELLRVMGIGRIVSATDGGEGWRFFQTYQPDIVITDAAMAPIDGFALVQKLRASGDASTGTVPIIMVSGHSEISAVEKARDVGVTEFLCKPLSPQLLYERIIDVLNRPNQSFGRSHMAGAENPPNSFQPFAGAVNPISFL